MLLRSLLCSLFLLLFAVVDLSAAERHTAVVDAVAKAREAVVNIRTEQIVQRRSSPFFGFGDSLFKQFFSDMLPPRSYKTQALGSGVIIDRKGYILTNAHVVDKASKIFVALSAGNKELEATLVGKDSSIDLAVLKINGGGNFPFLLPARSDDLLLGETVIAIGNPLGLGHSITTGIISSSKRRIQVGKNFSAVFIQTDALINPGNSGGPLININGELIGINTAIASQAQGIGFSIPIDIAKRVMGDLIEYGRMRRAYLGVQPVDVSSSFTRSHGDGGVLIEDLWPDSPAAMSGLQVADVILAIDGVSIASTEEFYSLLRTYTPGDRLQITLLRGLAPLVKTVLLKTLPDGYELSYVLRTFGFSLREGSRGLLVDKVADASSAARIGLKLGDQIAKIDGVEVETMIDFKNVMTDRLGRLPLSFLIVRDSLGYLVELP